jgi:hypothetical protein
MITLGLLLLKLLFKVVHGLAVGLVLRLRVDVLLRAVVGEVQSIDALSLFIVHFVIVIVVIVIILSVSMLATLLMKTLNVRLGLIWVTNV